MGILKTKIDRLRWRLFYALATKKEVYGVEILCDVHSPDVGCDTLFERMEQALALVAEYQPWRMNQIREYLALIILRRRGSNRAALITSRVVEMDWTFVVNHTPAEVAASVLHESVHARVRRCLGWGGEDRREWEEGLCRRAEVWFAEAIPEGSVVYRRAAAALEAGGENLAPKIDWAEAKRLDDDAYWDEIGLPKWLERLVRR